jgi:hypothetical protein
MRNGIVEKLRATLNGDMDSECKVVYVLCEVRKLLPAAKIEPNLFAIRFYCNWALHVDLWQESTTKQFMQEIDAYATRLLEGPENMPADHQMLREFVFLDTFRGQFLEFLKMNDLPTAICDDDVRWHEFLEHYAGVIEDGSLACGYGGRGSGDLKKVQKVIFTKGRTSAPGSHMPFELLWQIHLLDGRILRVEVEASDALGGQFIGNHITLLPT